MEARRFADFNDVAHGRLALLLLDNAAETLLSRQAEEALIWADWHGSEELDRLAQQWDDLSSGWSGMAASAYTEAWQDWHQGAVRLLDSLHDVSENVCRAAVAYEQQDTREVFHALQQLAETDPRR